MSAPMTTEVAGLSISIDSTDAKKAADDLNKVTTAGEKTEATAKRVQRSWEQAIERVAAEASGLNGKFDTLNSTQARMLAAVERVVSQLDRMTAAMEQSAKQTNTAGDAAAKTAEAIDKVDKQARQAAAGVEGFGKATKLSSDAALANAAAMTRLQQVAGVTVTQTNRLTAGATKTAESLSKVDDAAKSSVTGMNAASAGADKVTKSLKDQDDAAGRLTSTLDGYVRIAIGAFGVREIVQAADAWQTLENRLRLVTSTQSELAQALDDVFGIAQRTSQGMDAVAGVYQRFSQTATALGIGQREVAQLTETVGKAIAISGGSAASAEGALMQFGQALAAGALRGEELNSVLEGAPGLAQALATGLGVPVGALREMAAAGLITGEVMVEALTKARASIDDQFDTRIKTVAQSFTELGNAATRFIGEAAQGSGAASGLASGISLLADNLDVAVALAGTLVAVRMVAWLNTAGAAAVTAAKGMMAANTAMGALSKSMGLLGGPVGWAVTAIGLGVTAWELFGKTAEAATDDAMRGVATMNGSLDDMVAKFNELNTVQQRLAVAEKQSQIERAAEQASEALDDLIGKVSLAEGTRGAPRIRAVFSAELEGIVSDATLTQQEVAQQIDALVQRFTSGSKLGDQFTTTVLGIAQSYLTASGNVSTYTGQLAAMQAAQEGATGAINGTEAALRAQQLALGEFSTLYATNAEKMAAEIEKWDAALGGLTEDQRKRIVDRFTPKSTRSAASESEAQKFLKQISDRINALNLEGHAHEFVTDAQRDLAAFEQRLQQTRDKSLQQSAGLIRARLAEADAIERANREAEMGREVWRQHIGTIEEQIEAAHQQRFALEEQIATYGMTESQVMNLRAAEADEAAMKLESARAAAIVSRASTETIAQYDEEIAKLRDLGKVRRMVAGGLAGAEEQDKAKRQIDAQIQQWTRGIDQMGDLFREGFYATLEGGDALSSFGDNLKKTAKTALASAAYEAFAKPIMVKVMANLAGIVGGPGVQQGILEQAGLGGSSGMLGNLFKGADLFGGGSIAGSISGLADSLGFRLIGEGATELGTTLVNSAEMIGKAANVAGQVFGYGKAIFDLTEGNYGSAVGTAIGTYILPGIGTAIGSMLGGMLDNAFKGETRFGGSYYVGDLADGTKSYLRERPTATRAVYEGGPSGGDPAADQASRLLVSTFASFTDAAKMLGGAVEDLALFGSWEVSPEKGNSFIRTIVTDGQQDLYNSRLDLTGVKDSEEVFAAFQAELPKLIIAALQQVDLDDAFDSYLDKINVSALDEAGVQQVLATLEAMVRFRDMLTRLPFADLSGIALEAGLRLAEFSGGMDALLGNMQVYYDLVYSEDEKRLHLQQQLTDRFRDLGYEMPASIQGLRDLVESLDITTDAGLQARAEIYALAGAFGQLQDMLANLGTGATDANAAFEAQLSHVKTLAQESQNLLSARNRAGSALDQIDRALGRTGQFGLQREAELWAAMTTASYEQQIDLASELTSITLDRYQEEIAAAERLADLGASLRDYVAGLKLSDVSPLTLGERLAEAGSQYAEMLAKAQAGDTDAMAGLQGMADSYLRLARDYYASSDQYTQIFNGVTGGLDQLGIQAQTDAERQLAVGVDSLAELEQLRGVAQRAYDALDRQYQQSVQALASETALLADLGQDTGRLHDIANLLGSLPAELAARLQPFLDTATRGTVTDWYQEAGRGQGDAAGVDYWQGQLGTKPQDQVKDSFTWGLIADWYRDDLGRNAAESEIAYWVEYAKQQGTSAAYQAFLAGAQGELGRIPGFANGGLASGLAWVGERGPELVDFASPGRVYTNEQLSAAMFDSSRYRSGNSESVLAEGLRAVQQELAQSRKENAELQRMLAQVIASSAKANADDVGNKIDEALSRKDFAEQIKRYATTKNDR